VHALATHDQPVAHALPHPPQFAASVVVFTSHPLPAFASQFANPGLHEMPQVVPLHVAEAFAGVGHGLHDEPHVCGFELLAQPAPQA
jgi:hypothetical protein